MHVMNCRDKGPKSIYWVVGLIRGRLVVQEQINDSKDVRIKTPRASMTEKVGEGGPRKNASSAKQSRG